MLAEAGLTYHGAKAAGRNLLLPSPVGAARPTYLAPQAQLAGDLERPEPMLIVGFQGMRDFYPKLLAENLAKQGYPARATFAPLDLISSRRDNSPIQLAHGLENAPAQARLAAALKKAVRSGERVGLPAILGVEQHATALANLQEQTGATLFEIPTLPPSAPGMRLYLALRRQLMQLGVRVEAGMEAIGFHAEGRQIRWVKTETSARPLKHHARNFLLATGGVLGGGFTSDHSGRFWEVIFRLPLTAPQERTRWFRPQFLDARGHPVFQSGVQVNQRFQPVDDEGAPVYDNLWAAGGALAHADSIRERSLEGMAIATGMAAAQAIVSCEDDKMTG
jgi:glycerol-3-phosphate dehydrogenase subunit B